MVRWDPIHTLWSGGVSVCMVRWDPTSSGGVSECRDRWDPTPVCEGMEAAFP